MMGQPELIHKAGAVVPQGEGPRATTQATARNTETNTTRQFKAQLPRNAFLQVLSFLTSIAVGIVLTPYLVRHLGRAAYGLIPLAGVMTQYVSIVTRTVSSATGRFLTIALQRNDVRDANRVLNTAFFSYVALALLQVPIFGLIIYHANNIFTIPEPLYWDAIILLVCSAVSFLISLIAGVFGVPIYANNRLDISRALGITHQIARIAGIVILFAVYGPALRYVGYVNLVVGVSGVIATVLIGKRLAPMLKLDVHAYDWSKLRQIMGMGGWLLVNYMGMLLFLRIDIWVCNRFVGAEAAGEYAAVLQWSNLIRQGGIVLSGLAGPMIMIYYARSEMRQLIRLAQVSVRVLCLCLAVPISILCVFSSTILILWLGESFVHLAPLMVIMDQRRHHSLVFRAHGLEQSQATGPHEYSGGGGERILGNCFCKVFSLGCLWSRDSWCYNADPPQCFVEPYLHGASVQ